MNANDAARISVIDAIHGHSVEFPERASKVRFGDVKASVFREAMDAIPDEFHSRSPDIRERFIKSVIANARAVSRSPFVIAEFALD